MHRSIVRTTDVIALMSFKRPLAPLVGKAGSLRSPGAAARFARGKAALRAEKKITQM
jgi:hypothetical protein